MPVQIPLSDVTYCSKMVFVLLTVNNVMMNTVYGTDTADSVSRELVEAGLVDARDMVIGKSTELLFGVTETLLETIFAVHILPGKLSCAFNWSVAEALVFAHRFRFLHPSACMGWDGIKLRDCPRGHLKYLAELGINPKSWRLSFVAQSTFWVKNFSFYFLFFRAMLCMKTTGPQNSISEVTVSFTTSKGRLTTTAN
jgi:hypothetical protein